MSNNFTEAQKRRNQFDVECVFDGQCYRFRDSARCVWGRFDTVPDFVKPGEWYTIKFKGGVPVQIKDKQGHEFYTLPKIYVEAIND